ncbi:MAG: NAD-dependent epimerase/dehydratase [Thermoanaerobaculia bacterium]
MRNRLLVTGSTGFVGTPLVRMARGGEWDLHTVSRASRPEGTEGGGVHHVADLLDRECRRQLIAEVRPTHLIHLAWYVEPSLYWTSTENQRWLEASADLFESFGTHGGQRLVGIGTSAEYEWREPLLREEATVLRPASVYGEAKRMLGELAQQSSARHGFSAAWARLFMVYGPGEPESRFIPTVIRACESSATVRCEDLVRDLMFIEDAARALLALAGSSFAGPVNVGSGRGTSLVSVVDAVAREVGRDATVELIEGADRAPVVADVTRLRAIAPDLLPIPLEEGLALTIAARALRQRR